MTHDVTSAVIEIVTADLQRALDFYRLLGLPVPQADGPHVEVQLPGGNKLAFDTEEVIATMHPGWTPPTSSGRVAIAFGLATPAEVDALFERVIAAGHPGPLTPFDAPWGQRYATVADPDGTSVDLFAPLAS
jgi:uncharacterized glyoxalase superfamily protein PhnB